MTVTDQQGNQVDVLTIKDGEILAMADFEDYGIKSGKKYEVKYSSNSGACIFTSEVETRLWNNEIRPDVWAKLIYIKSQP